MWQGAAVVLAMGAAAGAAQAQNADGIALRDVSVVDTRTGDIAEARTILLRMGRIEAVQDGAAAIDPSYRIIEGAGRFVVPGYNDMHVHVLSGDADAVTDHDHSGGDETGDSAKLDLLLANGVTGFRQMSGSAEVIAAARALNEAIASGALVAPEALQVTGDIYLGQAPTPEAARGFVAAQMAAGSDFLKVVGGPREGVLAALTEAEALGFDVAGHLPTALSTADAIDAGWDVFEHLGATPGIMLDCARAGEPIRARMTQAANGPVTLPPTFLLNPLLYTGARLAPALTGLVGSFDPDMCAAVATRFVAHDVWQVPTLIRLRTMSRGGDAAYRTDANLRFLHPKTRALWEQMGEQFDTELSPETKAAVTAMYDLQTRVVANMHDAGVKMMAGSDVGGIWLIPGFSLHQEFAELEQAGLSPLSILQMTTFNVGAFLGRPDTVGVVAPGFDADLVVLDANPLESAANMASIAGVFTNGTYLDAADLEAMKSAISSAYGG
ncbi:amidohydrolase family protein [Mesobacterium pallidum]|uniref:amidohydrolase family protein n=1 Tax=Mesobacterium pallidum TaxID=2872037 RepID=UPI001EE332C7|nr:amidohydrolase family protein [Mesobacterium pallidum]